MGLGAGGSQGGVHPCHCSLRVKTREALGCEWGQGGARAGSIPVIAPGPPWVWPWVGGDRGDTQGTLRAHSDPLGCPHTRSTQAVRIQDGRYRHPSCYTCADCGLSLKMRGHFWVGDELFCEKHARLRYQGPPAGPGPRPVSPRS